MSRWNDRVQGWIFDPNRLAPEFPESRDHQAVSVQRVLRRCPRFRAWTPRATSWRSAGSCARRSAWTLPELYALPQISQVTRHICVEGWSAIGKWSGVRFSDFLQRIGADLTAKYVGFKCADKYHTSIDMPTALHPQTLLTFRFADQILPRGVRLPDEAAHSDQARLQESRSTSPRSSSRTNTRAATGRTRGTTGSAAPERSASRP